MEVEDEEMIEEDTPQEILKSLERHEDKPQPVGEETETINLGTDEEPRSVRTGTTLSPSERTAMIELLKDYKDVFAWLYEDMPGLDTDLVVHRLPLYEGAKPVKQKNYED